MAIPKAVVAAVGDTFLLASMNHCKERHIRQL